MAQILDNEAGVQLLAGYMLRRNADRLDRKARTAAPKCSFHFAH
jgi:hypothetical protein